MNKYFEFQNVVKLLCGESALERLANELEHLGAKAPMLLSDAVLAKIGTMQVVVDAMEAEGCKPACTFTDIPVDSSLKVVNEIAALYRSSGCDALVAVGGGSVIDTAKGVRLVLSQNADDILAIGGVENLVRGTHIPFVVVPTTSGTGSECTGVAVIRNDENGVKMEFLSPFVQPDAAVIDPRMTTGLPPKATASTGFDAMVHAIEACTCLQANPM
ncbi:MAG: iron-containing alcohol dehydrogenase, partial [Akkermansia sp.]|nr:iron-containing alcohol dehydrogenase [Akkermansia sp.]